MPPYLKQEATTAMRAAVFAFAVLILVASVCWTAQGAVLAMGLGRDRSLHPFSKIVSPYNVANGSIAPMGGGLAVIGEYYTILWIGENHQEFRVQVDTGSSDLLIPMKGCLQYDSHKKTIKCPHADRYYDVARSSTVKTISCGSHCNTGFCDEDTDQCLMAISYGDGSELTAYIFEDTISIGGNVTSYPSAGGKLLSTRAQFGGIFEERGSFEATQVDGILGLAYGSISLGVTPLFDRIVASGEVSDIFSMCMGQDGGLLVLGGVSYDHIGGDFVYANIVNESYYVVNLTGMAAYGYDIPTYPEEIMTIVDSGTTLLLVTTGIFAGIQEAFTHFPHCEELALCGSGSIFDGYAYGCLAMNETVMMSLPNITFTFDGVSSVDLPPSAYLLEVEVYDGLPCYQLGIVPTNQEGLVILGDVFMQQFYVVFDREQAVVGFAPLSPNVKCDATLPPGHVYPIEVVSSSDAGIAKGVLIGIIIGVVAGGLILVGSVLFAVLWWRRKEQQPRYSRLDM